MPATSPPTSDGRRDNPPACRRQRLVFDSLRTHGATGDAGHSVTMLANERLDGLFYAAIEATEEAILNALLAAETTTGRDGFTVHALDARLLSEALA